VDKIRRYKMTKLVKCRDLGFDCDAEVRAESTEKALEMVAQHAKEAHEMDEVTPELVEKVHKVMKEV
jgi:predicted small metal-binding protein